MSNIYKKRQTSDIYDQVYSASGNPSRIIMNEANKLQNESNEYLQSAKQDYYNSLNITISNGINNLLDNPNFSSNPQKLSEEMDNLMQKTMSNVVDNDVKEKSLVDYYIKKQSYVNKAKNNFIRQENQKKKDLAYIGIEEAYNNGSRAISNLLSGENTSDDIVEYFKSIKDYEMLLDEKNLSGMDVFTPYQKYNLRKKLEDMKKNSVINHIKELSPDEKYIFLENLSNDKLDIAVGYEKSDGGDITVMKGNISNYLTPEDYSYLKGVAKDILVKYNKLKPSKNKNTGISEREAINISSQQTLQKNLFSNEIKNIKKLEDKNKVMSLFDVRNRMISEYKKGNLDENDFKTFFEETAVPLVESADKLSGTNSWFYDSAFTDGVHLLKQIEGTTTKEKAYLYTRLYDTLVKDGIELDSGDNKDARRVKEIVKELKKDHADKKTNHLIDESVAKVLLGTDVVLDYNNIEKKTKNTKYRLWKKGDRLYKVYPDENGEFSNNSEVQEVF